MQDTSTACACAHVASARSLEARHNSAGFGRLLVYKCKNFANLLDQLQHVFITQLLTCQAFAAVRLPGGGTVVKGSSSSLLLAVQICLQGAGWILLSSC